MQLSMTESTATLTPPPAPTMASPPAVARISRRERETLKMLADGKTVKDIARELGISVKTAESHRYNLMMRLQIFSIAQLTKLAIREGITTLDD